jgi:plasmid maintenance system antidote protein VapI
MNMQSKYNLWDAQQNRENQKILAGVPTLKDLESTLKE